MKHHLLQTLSACILMLLFSVGAMAQTSAQTQAQAQQTQGLSSIVAAADMEQTKDKIPPTASKPSRNVQTTPIVPNNATAQYTLSEPYTQSQPVNLSLSGLRLVADSGSLMHDVTFSVSTITRSETPPLASNMLSVTRLSNNVKLLGSFSVL